MSIPKIEIDAVTVFLQNLHMERAKTVYPSDPEARWAVLGWVQSSGYREQLREMVVEVLKMTENWKESR